MTKTRTQKAFLNTTTSAIAEVVQLICTLILPRLILANFGSAYNGITMSAKQFLTGISILSVGITGATKVALYKSLAEKDIKQTSRIVRAMEKYMHKVGYALLALLVVIIIFYPLLVDTGYTWIEVAPLILAAGISAAGRYIWGLTYNALLTADQSVYIINIFSSVANILNVVFSVILIHAGCSIQIVKLGSSIILVLNPILRAIYVRKQYRLDRNCEPDNSTLSMRRDTMAHSIANIVHDNTDIIVLTIFTNVKIVSVYTVYNLVMNALKRTQQVFTSGTEAVYGDMWVKGETEKIRLNLGYYEYIISMFVSIVFSTSLVMILPFVSLYTKNVHDVDYILTSYAVVIIIAHMFYSFRTPYLTLVQGIGHYKQTKAGAYAEAVINLTVSIILVQFLGIVGVAIGTLVANVFRTLQYAFYVDNKVVKRGKIIFIKRIVWASMNVAVSYLATHYLTANYAYKSWGVWLLFAGITVCISIAVALVSSVVFYRSDMKGCLKLLKRIRVRGK